MYDSPKRRESIDIMIGGDCACFKTEKSSSWRQKLSTLSLVSSKSNALFCVKESDILYLAGKSTFTTEQPLKKFRSREFHRHFIGVESDKESNAILPQCVIEYLSPRIARISAPWDALFDSDRPPCEET